MRIGIYGGSFNPVHSGHLRVARSAVESLRLDRLLVVPAAVNPFKVGSNLSVAALNREWEIKLLTAAFAAVDRAEIDLREVTKGGVSYAIDTVREIAGENPGAELFFIVGDDSLAGLPRWRDYHELTRLCTFKSFPRTLESSTEIRGLFQARKVRFDANAADRVYVRLLVDRQCCPCEEFLGKLRDPSFTGTCRCGLYRAEC